MTRAVDVEGRGVRVNGRSVGVGSAIPDSAIAHYDAQALSGLSDGDAVNTWPDEKAGNDLTGSGPVYRQNGLNGYPSVEFNGSSATLDGSITSTSEPYTIISVFQEFDSDRESTTHSGSSSRGPQIGAVGGGWEINNGGSGSILGYSSSVSQQAGRLSTGAYNGSNSILRINQIEHTGDIGLESLDGFRLGRRGDASVRYFHGYICEVLILEDNDSTVIQEQEARLIDKWDLAI